LARSPWRIYFCLPLYQVKTPVSVDAFRLFWDYISGKSKVQPDATILHIQQLAAEFHCPTLMTLYADSRDEIRSDANILRFEEWLLRIEASLEMLNGDMSDRTHILYNRLAADLHSQLAPLRDQVRALEERQNDWETRIPAEFGTLRREEEATCTRIEQLEGEVAQLKSAAAEQSKVVDERLAHVEKALQGIQATLSEVVAQEEARARTNAGELSDLKEAINQRMAASDHEWRDGMAAYETRASQLEARLNTVAGEPREREIALQGRVDDAWDQLRVIQDRLSGLENSSASGSVPRSELSAVVCCLRDEFTASIRDASGDLCCQLNPMLRRYDQKCRKANGKCDQVSAEVNQRCTQVSAELNERCDRILARVNEKCDRLGEDVNAKCVRVSTSVNDLRARCQAGRTIPFRRFVVDALIQLAIAVLCSFIWLR
jgi:chromosome segregation ATPase